MKINVTHALYSVSMIMLAFITAIVVTKMISKYINQKKENDK